MSAAAEPWASRRVAVISSCSRRCPGAWRACQRGEGKGGGQRERGERAQSGITREGYMPIFARLANSLDSSAFLGEGWDVSRGNVSNVGMAGRR